MAKRDDKAGPKGDAEREAIAAALRLAGTPPPGEQEPPPEEVMAGARATHRVRREVLTHKERLAQTKVAGPIRGTTATDAEDTAASIRQGREQAHGASGVGAGVLEQARARAAAEKIAAEREAEEGPPRKRAPKTTVEERALMAAEVFGRIVRRLAAGQQLKDAVGAEPDAPTVVDFYAYLAEVPTALRMYDQALAGRAHVLVVEADHLVQRMEREEDPRQATTLKGAAELKLKLAEKLAPKRYGPKLDVTRSEDDAAELSDEQLATQTAALADELADLEAQVRKARSLSRQDDAEAADGGAVH